MESNLWTKFVQFVKHSLKEKFALFFGGTFIGWFGGMSLFFSGLSPEIITLGAYVLKFMGTLLMAFGSGLGTTAGAKWVERKFEKKSPPTNGQVKKGKDRAA